MFSNNKKPHPNTCEACPNRFSERGCPCWVGEENGIVETNDNGDTRILKGCFYQIMPKLMIHVIKSANLASVSANEARNKISDGTLTIADMISEVFSENAVISMTRTDKIEHKKD